MDADGLPLVGPGIDYTKVEAINQKRTIAFINHFVTHTARFLNRFSCVCEDKLENLNGRLQQLEISLSILEAKISSIPGLESVTAPQSSTSSTVTPTNDASSNATTVAAAPPAPPPPPGAAAPVPDTNTAEPAEPVPEAPAQNKVSEDPRYMKFFKMLKYGAATEAIKLKMIQEGLNPDYLDDPDAPAPEGGAPPPPPAQDSDDDDDDDDDSSDESESDFSD